LTKKFAPIRHFYFVSCQFTFFVSLKNRKWNAVESTSPSAINNAVYTIRLLKNKAAEINKSSLNDGSVHG